MAGEAIGFRRREPVVQLGIEARRAKGRVGEDNVGRLVGPVARTGVEERGIAPIVPDQVVGAEGDMALVLAEVIDLERPAVGAGEGEKSPAALEPGDVDVRDIAVERAEFDRLGFCGPVRAERGGEDDRRREGPVGDFDTVPGQALVGSTTVSVTGRPPAVSIASGVGSVAADAAATSPSRRRPTISLP